MWPLIVNFIRVNSVYVTFPFAVVIGFIGYNFENIVGRESTPWKTKSIQEERDERILESKDIATEVKSLKSKIDIPKTVLDRNDKSKLNS